MSWETGKLLSPIGMGFVAKVAKGNGQLVGLRQSRARLSFGGRFLLASVFFR